MKKEITITAEASNGSYTLLGTEAFEQPKLEPCIIQSAFLFKNGKRIIIYTGAMGITSYECDENWQPHKKPFTTCQKEYMCESLTEYHLKVRKMHEKEKLIAEHSTVIDW